MTNPRIGAISDRTLDTSVFAHLTKPSRHTLAYRRFLQGAGLAISFQTVPELLAAGYSSLRQSRLERLLSNIVELPHSTTTNRWYSEGLLLRARLKRERRIGSDAGDADLWIIANALEYGTPLASHDRQQVGLARAMGLDVFTALPQFTAGNPT